MTHRKKRIGRRYALRRLTAAVLIAVAAFIALISLPLSHPSLTAMMHNIAGRSGLTLRSMGGVSLTLGKGITMKDVRVEKRLSAHTHMLVEADRVYMAFRPLYIISNLKELSGIVRQFFPSARPAAPATVLKRYRRVLGGIPEKLVPAVHAITVERAIVRVDLEGGDDLVCMGAGARIVPAKSLPATANITVRCDTLAAGFSRIEKFLGAASAANGILAVEKIRGQIYGGRISGSAKVDVSRAMILQGALAIKEVDLNRIYFAKPRKGGTLAGRADCSVTFRKCVLHADSLAADGRFTMTRVVSEKIPLLASAVITLTVPRLARLEFDRISGDIAVAGGRITCGNVTGMGRPIDIEAEGWIGKNGSFEFDIAGKFRPEYKDTLGMLAWNALLPDAEPSWRRFECGVTGTFDNPRIHISEKISRRVVRNIFDNIKRDLRSALRR